MSGIFETTEDESLRRLVPLESGSTPLLLPRAGMRVRNNGLGAAFPGSGWYVANLIAAGSIRHGSACLGSVHSFLIELLFSQAPYYCEPGTAVTK